VNFFSELQGITFSVLSEACRFGTVLHRSEVFVGFTLEVLHVVTS